MDNTEKLLDEYAEIYYDTNKENDIKEKELTDIIEKIAKEENMNTATAEAFAASYIDSIEKKIFEHEIEESYKDLILMAEEPRI